MVIHQVDGAWGTPSVSPFCTKLQAALRMAEVPYTLAPRPDMLRAPRGKVPFAEIDGELVTDSARILDRVGATATLDGWLDPDQAAAAWLVRRTLEEATYFHLAYARWVDEDGWRTYQPVFAAALPAGLGWLITPFLRRTMRQNLTAQGTGRRTSDEVHALATDDLRAVAAVLGDKPFLCGDRPCVADATMFGMIDGLLSFPLQTGVHGAVWTFPTLVAHTNRIRARWFPELGLRAPAGDAGAPPG